LPSDTPAVLRALTSPERLRILEWLRDPVVNFPPQRDGDLVTDGVCVVFIADKLGVAQPTVTTHLQALARVGVVTSRRIGEWTFYKRDERAIRAFHRQLRDDL
jgi:DNA-binding transcriptional ArsR family regulator